MKLTSMIRKSLVGAACISFVLATAATAAEKKQRPSDSAAVSQERVVLVRVTGSWIPQRVVVMGGRQVNSASPLTVLQGNDLSRSGASFAAGILANDPSITFRRR